MKLYKKTAVICALLGLSIWNVALADGAQKEIRTPFVLAVETCGETVYVEGWYSAVFLYAVDENGGEHRISQVIAHGTGVGESTGIHYVWNDSHQHRAGPRRLDKDWELISEIF
jgi:hypothetical protein